MADRKKHKNKLKNQKNEKLHEGLEEFSWGGTTPQWEEEAETLVENIHKEDNK